MGSGVHGRWRASIAHTSLSAVQAAGDFLSSSIRYGQFRTATKLVLRRDSITTVTAPADGVTLTERADHEGLRAALVTDGMDSGGVEAVVELLALHLPEHGVHADVICAKGGRVAEYLRGSGIRVVEASSQGQAERALAALAPDVIQLHSAPDPLLLAAMSHGAPMVPVVHTTDVFRSPSEWDLQSSLADVAAATIAVSSFVGEHHRSHLARPMARQLVVIPNGVPTGTAAPRTDRGAARRQVASALGADLEDDTLAICLARCDPQKNLPGLVAGFLQALERRPSLRLVVAGGVQDWLEHAKADTLRRSSGAGDRIHLLGVSHAPTLLAAGDMFVLDSFFEGWPVAATEAAVAGLPLVLADVGGARELVGPHGERGVLVPNPAVQGQAIDARTIRQARRARVQPNRGDLVDAIVAVHDEIPAWRDRRAFLADAAAERFGLDPMVSAHAGVLMAAAAGT